MTATAASQYIREVLHHTEPPPPINARFFYTSIIPIDDPLSPLPPPASAGASTYKLPPKPFSQYDNDALDKAWNTLRRKLLKFNEERGEKDAAQERSRRPRKNSSLVRGRERGSSGSKASTARIKAAPPPSTLRQLVDGTNGDEFEPSELDLDDVGPKSATEIPHGGMNTSGTPFLRATSKKQIETTSKIEDPPARPKVKTHDTYEWDDPSHLAEHSPVPKKIQMEDLGPSDRVAVGISRLHQVEMPGLLMTPIYWTPVNDTAHVVRGTWFYQDTMLPVETPVANMLEGGYIELQVWTETWEDELKSAIEVGAEGEVKIVHKLWPEPPSSKTADSGSRPSSQRGVQNREENLLRAATATLFEGEPETAAQQRARLLETACDVIDVSTGPGGADNKASGDATEGRQGASRTYSTCGVIYHNAREARILKPTLLPSVYYGRRPLANYIRKGYPLGIPVVRGFDQQAWDKLHPPKVTPKQRQASRGVASSESGAPSEHRRKDDPDLAKSSRPDVTDLIFVIHGIGQKLSQRMESFNFTHAINAFRREIMVECGNKEVRTHFRKGMGGIMVLPVNWRQSLSFEEGGYRPDAPGGGKHNIAENEFTLNDITPDTLPSVRGIVSDVMLDVPYYMSHHQPKMIAAVIREANRVYALWCQNNPGFAEKGRVHIIAHSLGSVMAIDILSKQPTNVASLQTGPDTAAVTERRPDNEQREAAQNHLLFNTHNLFLAGSPAGFFLLLRRAQLRPRPPPDSASHFPAGSTDGIYGEPGAYGCIAVQNIYNLIIGYDPVAYAMNASVDARYAASLKKFFVPSNVPGYWFGSAGSSSGGTSWFGGRPSLTSARSARELELRKHEDMALARERMRALNDNGQIDYFIKYGGGMLEIQYLTMLGAHSAYWSLKDFIQVIVMETGRRPGAEGVLDGLRAVRKKEGNKK